MRRRSRPGWVDRLLTGSAAAVVVLALAACSPDEAAPSTAETGSEPASGAGTGAGTGARAGAEVDASAEDCDCRRSVKTPLENPIKPADTATAE